jgi:hypothetical protein
VTCQLEDGLVSSDSTIEDQRITLPIDLEQTEHSFSADSASSSLSGMTSSTRSNTNISSCDTITGTELKESMDGWPQTSKHVNYDERLVASDND